MTAGAPWSVKGIDPKAREIAKDLARRSGMTLGEWLNQIIMEDGPAAGEPPRYAAFARDPVPPSYSRIETPDHPGDELSRVTEALERLSSRIEAAESLSTQAISGVDVSVSDVLSRLDAGEREQTAVAARFEGLADDIKADQERLNDRLGRIEQEATGQRSAEALHALETALGKVADHVYAGEAGTSEQLSALRQDLVTVTERVNKGAAGLDASQMIEAVVSRLAERLDQAGARTNDAIRGLEVSFAHLDDRLRTTESELQSQSHEVGLDSLAASLSAQVDEARAEMTEKIKASADGRFDRMEQTLAEMDGHVQAAERRSAQAIERMGHEVLRIAENLGGRMTGVELRTAGAIEHVNDEVGRISSTLETRLNQFDNAGAQALEKLGGEIARITEKLSERIASAERRSAQAIDDVGDQVTRATERMQERNERVSGELADRIRQSEDRTARLLEEARERIDQRLGETQRRLIETAPPPAPEPYIEPDVAPFGQSAFSTAPLPIYKSPAHGVSAPELASAEALKPQATEPSAPETTALTDDLAAAAALALDDDDLLTPKGFTEDELGDSAPFGEPASFTQDAFAAKPSATVADDPFGFVNADEDDGFIKAMTHEGDTAPFTAPAAFGEPTSFAHPSSFDEPAPYAAQKPAAASNFIAPSVQREPADESLFVRPTSTRELIEQARAAARASSQDVASGKKARGGDSGGSLFSGFGLSREKKAKRGGALRTMLLLSGVVAAAGVSTAGYVLLNDKPSGATPDRVAAGQTANSITAGGEMARPLAAVALNPTPLATPGDAATSVPSAAAAANGPALYEEASRRIEAQDFSGVETLRKAANLGYAPAEFYLAKLYEDGQAGLRKDLDAARTWTERAADSGDRKAMHNLALYYFEGTGGPKNMTLAAQWFRKAADMGLVDSQYNLARLYEKGFGVSQNPAEAYKWYLIAARSGDADSRQSALQLKGQISPQAQAAAERAAGGFQPQGPDAPNLTAGLDLTPQAAQVSTPASGDVASLQRALSRLGYYQGPADGSSSTALRLAIAAYQRDQGLPGTGVLDSSSQQLLYAASQ